MLSVCLQNINQEQRQDVGLNNDSMLTNLWEHVLLSCYHLIAEMANALQHNTAVQLQMFREQDVIGKQTSNMHNFLQNYLLLVCHAGSTCQSIQKPE